MRITHRVVPSELASDAHHAHAEVGRYIPPPVFYNVILHSVSLVAELAEMAKLADLKTIGEE